MRTWGVRAALVGASVLVAATAIPAQASAGPLRVARPAVHARHQLGGLVNHRDPSLRPQRSLVTPRTNSAAGVPRPMVVLPTTVVAGTWTSLGPQPIADEKAMNGTSPNSDFGTASGRVTALVTDPHNASIVYAGTAGGGVWRSTDGGTNWATTMDGAPTLAIGALAIDAAGTTIYAATGEDNASSDSQYGQGILKSTDLGQTWAVAGTSGNSNVLGGTHIGGIAVDRNTLGGAEHVLVASDAGLWSSLDSGATWSKVSPASSAFTAMPGKTASGEFIQVMQDAVGHFWAAATDFCQTEAGDIFTSPDGNSWTNTAYKTQPSGAPQAGRIALDVSHDGRVAVAALASCANFGNLAGLERTMDGGASWSVSQAPNDYMSFPGTNPLSGQGWYDNVVAIDPTDATHFVLAGITVMVTTDNGVSFSDVGQPYTGGSIHPDFHALAFTGPGAFYAGNDGGVYQTSNLGSSWTNRNGNLGTLQFYNGAALDSTHIAGGSQDNGTEGILPGSTATFPAWQHYLDGDGGSTLIDPTPGSSTIFGTTPGGGIWKGSYTPPGSPDPQWPYDTFVEADPCPQGSTAAVCREPTAFVTPLLMDQTNPQRLLTATTTVYQSTTAGVPAGSSWTAISPVLATATAPPGGSDNISTLVMGKAATKTAFAGSYFGALWMSRNTDGGAGSWTQINGNLPPFDQAQHVPGNPWISGVAFNEANPSEAWVTIGAVRISGAAGAGHVWHTTNAGASGGTVWTDVSGTVLAANVPSDLVVNGIVYDPTGTGTIYIATDLGVLACATCAGNAVTTGTWATVGTGLPHVKVAAITEMQQNQIVAWTHGRGAWIVPVAPILDVQPPQLTFTVGEGGTAPSPQTFTVANDGVGTMNWTAVSTQNNPTPVWLQQPTPPNGSDVGKASTPVQISVNTAGVPAGIPAGTYQGTVTVTTPSSGSASVAVTLVVPAFPGQFKPVVPTRILDTRNNSPVTPSNPIDVQIAGVGGVPAMNSTTPPSAVVLNVTATNETQSAYLTIYPTGAGRPTSSNLNFAAHQNVPNLVEVALGAGGKVTVFNGGGSADVIFDVAGWVTTQGTVTGTDGRYRPVVPHRILDTRNGSPVGAQPFRLQVAGAPGSGIPAMQSGAPGGSPEAVVLNLTVTRPTASGFVTVYPSDASRPDASNINFVPGTTRANRVAVKLGPDGAVNIFNAGGLTDVVIDVNGWFTDSSATTGGGQFTGVVPSRIRDTRYGPGPIGPVGWGQAIAVQVSGQGGVPNMGDPVPPTSVVLNVTATNPSIAGFLGVYPSPTWPGTSDLNWMAAGQVVPNLVVVKLGPDGKIGIYNSGGSTHVVVDVFGWYQ